MKQLAAVEPLVSVVSPESVVSDSAVIKAIDVKSVVASKLDFSSDFVLTVIRDSICTAIVGYFEVLFNADVKFSFQTGPGETPTHWKQTVFFLREPVLVKRGDVLSGTISCRKNEQSCRTLDICLNINTPAGVQNNKYCLN
jgi:protein arginine N-methyltransferase 3